MALNLQDVCRAKRAFAALQRAPQGVGFAAGRRAREESIVAINNGCMPFTKSLISQAPDASGVFALWQSGGIIYYGSAATIRSALDGQFSGRAVSERRVTGCSW